MLCLSMLNAESKQFYFSAYNYILIKKVKDDGGLQLKLRRLFPAGLQDWDQGLLRFQVWWLFRVVYSKNQQQLDGSQEGMLHSWDGKWLKKTVGLA